MPRNSYKVLVDGQVYARDMELSTALILAEGLFDKWYSEKNLAVTIQRDSDELVEVTRDERLELTK